MGSKSVLITALFAGSSYRGIGCRVVGLYVYKQRRKTVNDVIDDFRLRNPYEIRKEWESF